MQFSVLAFFDFIGGGGEGTRNWQRDAFLVSPSPEISRCSSALLGIPGSEEPWMGLAVAVMILRVERESWE